MVSKKQQRLLEQQIKINPRDRNAKMKQKQMENMFSSVLNNENTMDIVLDTYCIQNKKNKFFTKLYFKIFKFFFKKRFNTELKKMMVK